ncbi:hypothetical protein [Carnobacterium jeotgali]
MMKILKEGMWKRPIEAADLLERKGCDHFTLLENDVQISGRFYELWWYSYQDENHILAKGKQYPYFLHFFLLEAGDTFEANDFATYIKTGELKAQQPNLFEKII